MRGVVPVELPAPAQERLLALRMACDAALDAAGAAVSRLNGLPLDASAGQRDRLGAERDRQQARHRAFAGLSSRLNQWLSELPRHTVLESAPAITVTPKNGEKLLAAVERLRAEVASTKQSLQRMRSAGLPLDAQHSLIVEAVAEKARRGRPSVRITSDVASISWPEGTSIVSLMAWLQPREMIDALSAELVEPEGAMSTQERELAVGRLQEQLDGLEMQEAVLLTYAAENGVDVLPRIDMSPSAYLGVVITPAAAQVA